MKITLEGSPKELKDFFSTDVNGKKLWALTNKKEASKKTSTPQNDGYSSILTNSVINEIIQRLKN